MIIIEGPDGSGKTTLVEELCKEFNLERRRAPTLSSTRGPLDRGVYEFAREEIRREDNRGVYDRLFAISEPIYQLATPGRPLLVSGPEIETLVADLITSDPFIIFCLPPWRRVRAIVLNAGRDRLQGVDDKALEKIHWAYHNAYALYEMQLRNVFLYDYTALAGTQLVQLKTAVGNYIRKKAQRGS